MEQELIKLGLQGGVAISVLIALYFVLSKIAEIIKNRNGYWDNKKLHELEKLVMNDYRHELNRLWDAIDKINERLDDFERRITKLEVKINGKTG
jgi:peptidoglycan hydrolase CwlO-like protein